MNQAIILHGMPSKEEYYNPESASQSNKHWLPWLQRQLILKDILAQTPELPHAYAPDYEAWSSIFEQFPVNESVTLVGHSCGAGFLVRWLSEHRVNVGKVALVAPWLDPKKTLSSSFFRFEIDPNFVKRASELHMFISSDDDEEMLQSVERLERMSRIEVHKFTDRGHFTFNDMKTEEFPELREALIG